MAVVKSDRESKSRSRVLFNLIKFNFRPQPDRYRNGRGNSIYDNVNGEMMIVADEDPEKIGQGETCATLMKSSKGNGGWFVWDVDEGFKSQDKWLQDLVDE